MNYLKNYNTKEIEDEPTRKHKKNNKIRIPPKKWDFLLWKRNILLPLFKIKKYEKHTFIIHR